MTFPVPEPPRARPIQYVAPLGTRWQKEKAAAGEGTFDFPDDPTRIGPWVLGECVGKGATGRVKIARHCRTGQLAAVKILPLMPKLNSRASLRTQHAKSEKFRLGVDKEIVTMKLMHHPNIMRIYDVYEGEKELYLVLEYVEGGELFDFLVNRGKMAAPVALAYFKQIISGLNYAHTFSITHRDLKPENILIQSLAPPLIKIADWGMATFAPPATHLETSCGSPHYASPEIVNGEKYSGPASDIWSCGVILFALLTGRLPFDHKDIKQLLAMVRVGQYDLPTWIDRQARDLVARMLVVDVSQRITMPEILAHPWMQNYTPGVEFFLTPSLVDLARPTAHIDSDVLESLRVICGKHANPAELRANLLSPAGEGAFVKAFYFLLQKHRELTLSEHGITMDVDESGARVVTKQYTHPVSRMPLTGHEEVAEFPQSLAPYRRRLSRGVPLQRPSPTNVLPPPPTDARRHLSPEVGGSTISSRSRAPSPAGPRAIQRAASTPADDLAVLYLSPPASAPRPLQHTPVLLARPCAQQRSQTSPATRPASAIPMPSHRRQLVSDAPFVGSPQCDAGQFTPAVPLSLATASAGPLPLYAPVPVRAGPEGVVYNTSRAEGAMGGRMIDPRLEQLRASVVHASAQADPSRSFGAHERAATDVTMREGGQRPFGAHRRADTTGTQWTHTRRAAAGDKENWGGAPRGRGGENGASKVPFGVKQQLGLGHLAPPAPRGLGFDKASGFVPMRMDVDVPEVKGAGKRERKGRPAPLDLHSSSNKRTAADISPSLLSPLTAMTPAGEARGWFSNLFHWKQTHMLYSVDSIARTRDETVRLLQALGVGLVGEDVGGRLVLRCLVADSEDAHGPKGVRFRVEFSAAAAPGSFLPLSPGGARRASRVVPTQLGGFECMIVFVQEKGSVATFRAVYGRLREEWRLDTLQTPSSFVERAGVVAEHGQPLRF